MVRFGLPMHGLPRHGLSSFDSWRSSVTPVSRAYERGRCACALPVASYHAMQCMHHTIIENAVSGCCCEPIAAVMLSYTYICSCAVASGAAHMSWWHQSARSTQGCRSMHRLQDVRATEVDRLVMGECFRPGDIVRAEVCLYALVCARTCVCVPHDSECEEVCDHYLSAWL